MPTYTLRGGPCDGRRRTFDEPPVVGKVITCEQFFYEFGGDGIFHLAAEPLVGSGGPTTVRGKNTVNGWHELQRAVNRSTPQLLARTRRLRMAAVRKVHKALR